ncbi:alanine racemase [Rhodococcus sp. NPDC059968]|uniref:alanine racemase n=1 Tax=Rhodococcus sp. NPDC059968 TaxID=3347017 RepID=UPI0036727767
MTVVNRMQSVPLPPLTTPWTDAVTGDARLLRSVSDAFGGPVHLLDPTRFTANTLEFAGVFDDAGVTGTVYFGKKANKASAFVDAIADLAADDRRTGRHRRFGIDVASAGEFRQALAAGVRGSDLLITGPHKPTELLTLAVRHDAIVTVDSPTELKALADLSRGLRVRIMLRALPSGTTSRFGMTDDELTFAEKLASERPIDITLLGYSFHLSGYSIRDRRDHAHRMIDRIQTVRRTGRLAPDTISLGGGLPISYVHQENWQQFLDPRTPHHFHAGKTFDSYYPYYSATTGAAALRAILTDTDSGATPLAHVCQDNDISLFVEPGRALLDRAGVTVFPILGVKDRSPGLIIVDGTSLSLSEQWFDTEFVPDPQLVAEHTPVNELPFFASVGASTCLESDMLTWRVIEFPYRPTTGSYLVYHNTAGYQMDSNESAFHDMPIPPKVVVTLDDGHPRWTLDRRENY